MERGIPWGERGHFEEWAPLYMILQGTGICHRPTLSRGGNSKRQNKARRIKK